MIYKFRTKNDNRNVYSYFGLHCSHSNLSMRVSHAWEWTKNSWLFILIILLIVCCYAIIKMKKEWTEMLNHDLVFFWRVKSWGFYTVFIILCLFATIVKTFCKTSYSNQLFFYFYILFIIIITFLIKWTHQVDLFLFKKSNLSLKYDKIDKICQMNRSYH